MTNTENNWTPEPWNKVGKWPTLALDEWTIWEGGNSREVLSHISCEGFSISESDAERARVYVNARAANDPAERFIEAGKAVDQ